MKPALNLEDDIFELAAALQELDEPLCRAEISMHLLEAVSEQDVERACIVIFAWALALEYKVSGRVGTDFLKLMQFPQFSERYS